MKNGCLRVLGVSALIGLILWGAAEVMFVRPARLARTRIKGADYEAVLHACRLMMSSVSIYTNESSAPSASRETDRISIRSGSAQFNRSVPAVLTNLQPDWLLIRTNEMVLIFCGPPCRVNVHAFAPGAKESGTEKLTAGLWLN